MLDPSDRRKFFRVNLSELLEFKALPEKNETESSDKAGLFPGISKNISPSGVLFETYKKNPPKLSTILWLNLDFRALNICQEIEKQALVVKNGVLGRVVRIEENPKNDQLYDVGVCFLTRDQSDSRDVQKLLSGLSAGRG